MAAVIDTDTMAEVEGTTRMRLAIMPEHALAAVVIASALWIAVYRKSFRGLIP